MKFWWVNHNQTYRQEIEGGYVWSPKTNKDGSKNQTYVNLTVVRPGDIVFSYAGQEIRAIGIVEPPCIESNRPETFGKSGEQWQPVGWLVPIRWELLNSPFRPKNHLSQIVPLLPSKYSPLQSDGTGNQKFYLTHVNEDLGHLLLTIASDQEEELDEDIELIRNAVFDDLEESNIRNQSIAQTEQRQLIWARRGQGIFRINLDKIEKGCRLTGVNDRRVLIASHIKPWRTSDNAEKLDGNNGLFLSPHVDKLFDSGWISFTDDGRISYVNDWVVNLVRAWGMDPYKSVGAFNEEQKLYLDYHRSSVFGRRDTRTVRHDEFSKHIDTANKR